MGYGIGEYEESQAAAAYQHESSSSTAYHHSHPFTQQGEPTSTKPPHSHGVGAGIGMAAAGAAAGYMIGHHHDSSSPMHSPQYPHHHPEHGAQYGISHNHAMMSGGAGAVQSYQPFVAQSPGFYPPSTLAMQHRHKDPLTKFVDFWRDPEGVGRFEDYTETIGVCKYCFEPGTSSMNAPRRHNYRPRRHSADRYSTSNLRVLKSIVHL